MLFTMKFTALYVLSIEFYWFSHSLAKRTIELDITRENIEIVNAKSLLNSVTRSRDVLLNELI